MAPRGNCHWNDGAWSCTNNNYGRAYLPTFSIEVKGVLWDIILDSRGETTLHGETAVILSNGSVEAPDPDDDYELTCRNWNVKCVRERVEIFAAHLGVEAPSVIAMFHSCDWVQGPL